MIGFRVIDVGQCIDDLERAAKAADFSVSVYGSVNGMRLLGLTRRAEWTSEGRRGLYLSAGIHGDEPAGPLALLELLEKDALPRQHDWSICPLMNPSGLTLGTRENGDGIDLNRDYRDFRSHEIRCHRDWVKHHIRAIDVGIHLHEDWEAQGFYLYELNFGEGSSLAGEMLDAARQHLPIEMAECIDGRTARAGIIRPERMPDLPEGHPESIYLYQQYGGRLYTLETPSEFELARRTAALQAAVRSASGLTSGLTSG